MNIKSVVGLVAGAFVGWKIGERVMPGTVGEIGGAVVGAVAGSYVAKKL